MAKLTTIIKRPKNTISCILKLLFIAALSPCLQCFLILSDYNYNKLKKIKKDI